MARRAAPKANPTTPRCPHYFQQVSAASLQPEDACDICDHVYYTKNEHGDLEIPVRLACGHIFGKDCISEWLRERNTCPYRDVLPPNQPRTCSKCRRWDRRRGERSHTVIVVHASEMFRAFKEKLDELAADDKKLFGIANGAKTKLLDEFQWKLREYDRQFHPPAAFARMMDPMLGAYDRRKVRRELGWGMFKMIPHTGPAKRFTWSLDVVEDGELDSRGGIPWITQCIREWATEMLEEFSHEGHNHIQEGYEVKDGTDDVVWAVRSIVGYRRNGDGTVTYKVRWEGHEHWDVSEEQRWVPEEDFASHDMHEQYDHAHGIPPYRRGGRRWAIQGADLAKKAPTGTAMKKRKVRDDDDSSDEEEVYRRSKRLRNGP
ncbi:hypothetical protein BU16DRAFT_598135 [Lophium mytilinum]|uniref:RING-type domain-containing protein n=1 Tax=Lophium mytilinum TaxID=390894 RepID=A0A6A6QAI0_9PEZI|nr:hypothetical protein BU16DRAFT_598135 [Lophium mytilinum]